MLPSLENPILDNETTRQWHEDGFVLFKFKDGFKADADAMHTLSKKEALGKIA